MSYHGIALNVTVDLADFDLIDPCGMPGVASTSIAAERGEPARRRPRPRSSAPRRIFADALAAELGAVAGAGSDAVAAGLFELRKDPITGWWVATVVDRAFHRDRFARAAEPVDDHLFGCANCRRRRATASASGCSRTSPSTSSGPGRTRASSTAGSARSRSRRRARRAAGGRSSRRPASTARSTRSATR